MSLNDPWAQPGFIYLYHFDRWLGTPGRNGARHYLGFVDGNDPAAILARKQRHLSGDGAAIMAAAVAAGIPTRLTRVWIGSRHDERRFKQTGHFDRHCPVCRSAAPADRVGQPVLAPEDPEASDDHR